MRASDIKATWKLINQLLNKDSTITAQTVIPPIKTHNNHTPDANETADLFKSFFTSVGEELASKIPSVNLSFRDYLPAPNPSSFMLFPTTSNETLNIILNLNSPSSQGNDQLSSVLLKSIAHVIANPLSIIINHSFINASFPDSLKIAKVIPIYKSGSKSDISNYRPISLLNTCSKIYEKLIYVRLIKFINNSNLLYTNQFGFRSGYSTEHALLTLIDTITSAINKNNYVCSILIDVKKAFDAISHDIWLSKLENYGFRGHTLAYFSSYLKNRKQYVSINSIDSSHASITYGVPQGSIIGPVLFLLYINDLQNSLHNTSPILFADDNTLTYYHKTISELFRIINKDLSSFQNWLITNKLTINSAKTQFLFFHKNIPTSNLRLLILIILLYLVSLKPLFLVY